MSKGQGAGRGQTREQIAQISPRIDPKPFARDDQVACGDDTANATAGEQCDDGNTTDGDG